MFNLLDHNSSGFITFYDFIEQIPAKDNVSDPTINDSLSLSKKSPSTINSKTVKSLFKYSTISFKTRKNLPYNFKLISMLY